MREVVYTLASIDLRQHIGERLRLHGLLLAKGNRYGGKCWLVADRESRNEAGRQVLLEHDDSLPFLLDFVPAFGGGEYVLAYAVDIEATVELRQANTPSLKVSVLDLECDGERFRVVRTRQGLWYCESLGSEPRKGGT